MVFKSMTRSLKNLGYSDVEVLVREATANNKSQPPEDILREIARLTYSKAEFTELMPMLDRRLNDRTRQWRHVYKSLCLVQYLLLAGSLAAIEYFRTNAYLIKTLREFQFLNKDAVDRGELVRSKAREVSLLLSDRESLNRARAGFNGVLPMRSASISSESSESLDNSAAVREAERAAAAAAAAARREREAEAKRQFALQEEAARARAAQDEMERQRLEAELARAQAEEQARIDAAQQAQKQAQEAIQAQQLEMARWQVEQSKMNMYGTWPQYTGMYVQSQPTSFMPMMPMQTGFVQPQATGMVGSNNPFAPTNTVAAVQPEHPAPSRTPSLDMSRDADTRSHSSFSNQPSTPPSTATNPYSAPRQHKPASAYMDQLDNLLASGDGVDTFGNAGNQRLGHLGNRAHLFTHNHTQSASAVSPFA